MLKRCKNNSECQLSELVTKYMQLAAINGPIALRVRLITDLPIQFTNIIIVLSRKTVNLIIAIYHFSKSTSSTNILAIFGSN
jgi:hypothetical protein